MLRGPPCCWSESESDSCLSQCPRTDCNSAEPQQRAHDFDRSVAKGEAGVMGLSCLFDGLPYLMEPLGGGSQAEFSPGLETVGAGTQSGPQSDVSGMLGGHCRGRGDS